MSGIVLGSQPTPMTLVLNEGSDFVATLVNQSGSWPATVVITLEVGTATWTATIDTTDARFEVDQVDVAAVITEDPKRFSLWYTDGETRLLWGRGNVMASRA